MERILYYNYCAFLVLFLLMFSLFYRGMTKGRVNKVFLGVVMLCLCATAADTLSFIIDKILPGAFVLQYLLHGLYLLLHNITPVAFIVYILVVSDTDDRLKGWKNALFFAPLIISSFFIILSFVGHGVFYIDEEGAYHRTSLMLLMYASAAFYTAYYVFHIITFRKIFGIKYSAALLGMSVVMVIALLIQFFYPQYLLEMFASAIGLLMMSVTIHRPEEYMDTETGFGKRSAYTTDISNALLYGRHKNIIMLNIQNYVALRDMLGYSSMTELLRKVANKIDKINRDGNYHEELYYLGLGKFRMVVDSKYEYITDSAASEIHKAMQEQINLNSMEINLNCLICVTRCPEDVDDVESLMTFGNDLNHMNNTGEVLYASDVFQKKHYDIMRHIDTIIENALSNHKFEVYYQPIFSVKENRFNCAEALLRLKDDEYGFISPEFFIPAAEKSGAIHRIGAYVLEEVCSFIASPEFEELDIDYVEVNLSVTQCLRADLSAEVLNIMKKYDIDPGKINLEITETAASNSQSTLMENICSLTDSGISFSLDDFGTGYSNMSRIASMPFRIVKLDKSFANLERNDKLLIVLENTIRMIKDMDMKIVVEGIETEELVKQFSELNCEYIQGYYFSRPIPKNDFVKFIRENKKK